MSIEDYVKFHPNLNVIDLDRFCFAEKHKDSNSLVSTLKVKKSKKKKRSLSSILKVKNMEKRRRALVLAGYSDSEIAEFEGLTRKGISSYRLKVLGLPPNRK